MRVPGVNASHQSQTLALDFAHPGEDVVRCPDGVQNVVALVQHHAVGALSRGVGDFRARRLPSLGNVCRTWVAQIAGTWAASRNARIRRDTWQTWLVGEMAQAEPSRLPGRIDGLVASGLEILTRRRFAISPKSFLTVLPCPVHRPAWARWSAHQAPDGFGLGTHNDLGARSTDVKLRVPRTFLELSSLGSLPA
jgi:hypothetical protein